MEDKSDTQYKVQIAISPQNNIYPYCIVWTALPCLTCCFPCIGHTGICKSDGTIYDFVGYGPIHSGELAFGSPLKYVLLDHQQYSEQEWDEAVEQANRKFSHQMHNIVTNNCHHHVAEVLNNLKYKSKDNWSQVDIALLAIKGKHTGLCSFYVYILFFLIIGWIFFV